MISKLLFVYNANSGKVNAAFDSLHKIASPSTYKCKLCSLTYGVFSENDLWKRFREASEVDLVFLHKDEFLKSYRSKWLPKFDFPVVLSEENEELAVFLSSEAINTLPTVEALIDLIRKGQEKR